jgi:hypothetical protein
MDDDLRALSALLAKPGPSRDTVDRGRRRLQHALCHPARRRMVRPRWSGWVAASAGLAAAAAAVTVAVASGPVATVGPGSEPGGPPPAAVRLSGRQILLAAATAAAHRPAASGIYWYVKTANVPWGSNHVAQSEEIWTRRDGRSWTRFDAPGQGVRKVQGSRAFFLEDTTITFRQIQRLPASPAALERWVVGVVRHEPGVARSATDIFVSETLMALLYQVPALPNVRAAAFRALAALPYVKSLGPVQGGQDLLIANSGGDRTNLVVNTATSHLVRYSAYGIGRGATIHKGSVLIVAAEWTNRLPKGAG